MCVHAHARWRCCLCMWVYKCTQPCKCIWRPEGPEAAFSIVLQLLFCETDSCWSWNLLFSTSPLASKTLRSIYLNPLRPGYVSMSFTLSFFKAGAADPNTGLRAWEASSSLTEPSPFPVLGISIGSSSHRCVSPIVCWNLTDYASIVVLENVLIGDIWSLIGLYLPAERPETSLFEVERNPLPSKVLETSIRSLFTFCSFLPQNTTPSRSQLVSGSPSGSASCFV